MGAKTLELLRETKERVVHLFKECVNRVTEFEKLADDGNSLLNGCRKGVEFLRCPPIKKSDLVEKILKSNETEGLNSYFCETTRCKNSYDVDENINKLNASYAGLLYHLTQAKTLVSELEMLVEETVTLVQCTTEASIQYRKDIESMMGEVATSTCHRGFVLSPSHTREYEASEYALMTCLICSMVKQEYKMQEKIITSLKFNESEELESYYLMWTLRPNLQDDFLTMAKDHSGVWTMNSK